MKLNILLISLVLLGFVQYTIAQSAERNYIHTWDVQVPTNLSSDLNINTSATIALQTIQYFDGLGRPIQIVQKGFTPDGNDLIKPIEYNEVGLDVINFEPYVGNTPTGLYRGEYARDHSVFYNSTMLYGDDKALSPIEYEKSPLNRILRQGSPGDDWQLDAGDHNISFEYLTNNTSDAELMVNKWEVSGTTCTKNSVYENNQLYVTKTIGEEGEINYEFKDKQGQVILKRSILGSSSRVDTYYVYDDFGLLRFVISPEGSAQNPTSFNATSDVARQFVYCYTYDSRNRLIEKQIPGKEPEYYVYDRTDKVILYQDGNMRTKGTMQGKSDWAFTKYDALGRVIITGMMYIDKTKDRATLQDESNRSENRCWEILDYTGTVPNSENQYYSNVSYPVRVVNQYKLLSISYYDTYRIQASTSGNPSLICPSSELIVTGTSGTTPVVEPYSPNVHGLPTVNFVGSEQNNIMLPSVTYYDNYGRVTRMSKNHHITTTASSPTSGYDLYLTDYKELTQNVSNARHSHYAKKQTTSPYNYLYSFTEQSQYTYDHAGRQIDFEYTFNGSPVKQKTHMVYDKLGRVISKQIKEDAVDLQVVDYFYNIKGWLTGINNPAQVSATADLFGMDILYEKQNSTLNNTKAYNGNISAIQWQTAQPTGLVTPVVTGVKAYKYEYDELNRLLEGVYVDIANSSNNNLYSELIGTGISGPNPYDLNGNIKSLKRYGKLLPNNINGAIDQLTYYYKGNQLIGVNDQTTSNNGGDFLDNGQIVNPDIMSTWEYTYDENGNLKLDKNKGIIEIKYNSQNLPVTVQKQGNYRLEYLYDAAGSKLRQDVYEGTSTISKTTDFVGNVVYENGIPSFVNYSEGRILINTNGTWMAEIFLKDHLGNTRVAFCRQNGVIKIRQVDSYYPFGMNIKGLYQSSADTYKPNEYLYNGKMMQDEIGLNLLDYGARFYDPVLARWHSVDPLAEKYRRWSPYNYCVDNPLRFIDPDGMGVGDFYGKNGKHLGNDGNEDDKVFIVTDKAEARTIRKTDRIGGVTDAASVKSAVETTQTEMKESLDVLKRTEINGGKREESSVVTPSGEVIRGKTGSEDSKKIGDGGYIKKTQLPSVPGINNTSIHSHETYVGETTDGKIASSSATEPGPGDPTAFKKFNRNIIVGNLGYAEGQQQSDGSYKTIIPSQGVVIYDRNSQPLVSLTKEAVQRITK